MAEGWQGSLEKIDDYRWRIPKRYKQGMRVDGVIYADETLLKDIRNDKAAEQVANVAFLPGIVSSSMAMPDIHWGYGFPIGGVAATDISQGGVISPGGVGFDINCGVRLMRTNLGLDEIKSKIKDLIYILFSDVPSGVGSKGDIKVSRREEKELLVKGARWAVERGLGEENDLLHCEEEGAIAGADPSVISDRAYERGKAQSGTLGSGNHFIEVQVVDEIYDSDIADVFGVHEGQVTVMIHSGSRGFGYQVCDEYTKRMIHCLSKYKIEVPDRQLACAPVESSEGQEYLSAMRAAANYAWANRQCLMHLTRLSFERAFGKPWQRMGMSLVYDVAHNIAKIESYDIDGKKKKLCVHRKGATRALGPNHPALPDRYRPYGQPVIIPGDMGRNSYLLVGTEKAKETFYSSCHGAGRLKSRSAAIRSFNVSNLLQELEQKGIIVKASNRKTIAEEAPLAYKNVGDVVNVVHNLGISKKVCRMRPLGVIKG
ncbi:RtcB family protein [Thermoproteota archaeon]